MTLGYSSAYNSSSTNGITTGYNNTFVGAETGNSATITGNNLTCLGYNSDPSSGSATNEITLGDSNITTLRCADTTIASLSDRRDKTDIKDSKFGLDFINKLRPAEFIWKRRESNPVIKITLKMEQNVLDLLHKNFKTRGSRR